MRLNWHLLCGRLLCDIYTDADGVVKRGASLLYGIGLVPLTNCTAVDMANRARVMQLLIIAVNYMPCKICPQFLLTSAKLTL